MNKTKTILPVAALVMMPLFTSCNKAAIAEVLLNDDDCVVYKYGPGTFNVKIDDESEDSKHFKFKDEIKVEDIEIPTGSKFAGKQITSIKTLPGGTAVEIAHNGVLTEEHPFGTVGTLRIKKDAFNQESRFGGRVRVALRNNHYLVQHKETDDGFEYKVVSFGADFAEELISDSKANEPKEFHVDKDGSFIDNFGQLIGITIANWTEFVEEYGDDVTLTIKKLEESFFDFYEYLMSIQIPRGLDNAGELNHPDRYPNLAIDSKATAIGEVQTAGGVIKDVTATISSEAVFAEFAEAIR